MNLIIDIGNTFSKIFVFNNNEIVHKEQFENLIINDIQNLLHSYPIQNTIISSVSINEQNLFNTTDLQINKVIYLNHDTPLPFKNKYLSPETLGKDRIAAIAGAYTIFPSENVLVIDAGTAVKFDFINSEGEYIGGNISPGLKMRFNALNQFTSRLPLYSPEEEFKFIGQNTKEAIINGVQNGIIFEINTYITKFERQYNNLKVILTGGDTFFFAHKLKNRIFAEPFLVALGLNRILQDNVK